MNCRTTAARAACPDHLVHTKRTALWVSFDPASEGAEELRGRLREGVRRYREGEATVDGLLGS